MCGRAVGWSCCAVPVRRRSPRISICLVKTTNSVCHRWEENRTRDHRDRREQTSPLGHNTVHFVDGGWGWMYGRDRNSSLQFKSLLTKYTEIYLNCFWNVHEKKSQKSWFEDRLGLLEIIEWYVNRKSFYLNIKININLKIYLVLSSCEHLQLIYFVFHSGTTSRKLLYFLGTPQHKWHIYKWKCN